MSIANWLRTFFPTTAPSAPESSSPQPTACNPVSEGTRRIRGSAIVGNLLADWGGDSETGSFSSNIRFVSAGDETPFQPTLIQASASEPDSFHPVVAPVEEDWMASMLPESFRSAWNDADRLYELLLDSIGDAVFSECLPAAERLRALEANSVRSTCVLAVLLGSSRRLEEADRVLNEHLNTVGEDGYICVGLAKNAFLRNDFATAKAWLHRALAADPNQADAVRWLLQLLPASAHRELLETLEARSGSWFAKLMLAAMDLAGGDVGGARKRYASALAVIASPVPGEVIEQVAGDLERHGQERLLVDLLLPLLDPGVHDHITASVVVKALIKLNELREAAALAERFPPARESARAG